jgi:biopolymer transport protein ExbD
MVDVVMVILIFFMASAVVMGPEWFVPARLPKTDAVAPATATTPPPRVVLTLTREGSATVIDANGKRLALAQLAASLGSLTQSRFEDAIILVQPAADVPYEDVVRVHAACSEAGYRKVGLGR